jgi:predicted transcriptional regulator
VEQYEVIKKELLFITSTATKIEGMENRLQALVEKERGEIKKELSLMNASKQRIEDELGDKLSDKWDIVVKLRSQTYDKLMKEYKKIEENLILNRTEIPDETIDNEPQEDE